MQKTDEGRLDAIRHLGDGPPVLSVYLDLQPGRNVEHGHGPALMDLLRGLRAGLSPELLPAFEAEAERALEFVRGQIEVDGRLEVSGHTLVLFASQPRGLWETFSLAVKLPPQAHFGPRPSLAALEEPVADEGRTLVALVDRERARFVSVRHGAPELDRSVRDYVPRKGRQLGRKHQKSDAGPGSGAHQSGGDASSKLENSVEAWVDDHLEKAANLMEEIGEDLPFDWLVVGGPEETANRFIHLLTPDEGEKLAGHVHLDLGAKTGDVAAAVLSVIDGARLERDTALVNQASDLALAGGRASLGWPETLTCLLEGRVQHLLLGGETHHPGVSCSEGHHLATEGDHCPVCGKSLDPVADLASAARRLARDTSADVVSLHPGATALLADNDGVAAILRY